MSASASVVDCAQQTAKLLRMRAAAMREWLAADAKGDSENALLHAKAFSTLTGSINAINRSK